MNSSSSCNLEDNVPVCNCGEVAQLLTVRREDSVNKGTQLTLCIHYCNMNCMCKPLRFVIFIGSCNYSYSLAMHVTNVHINLIIKKFYCLTRLSVLLMHNDR